MDKQKKQIIALIVFAVAALGAGSYFVFFRGTGEDAAARHMRTGPVERRTRESSSAEVEKRKKRARPTKKRTARVKAGPERRERTGPDMRPVGSTSARITT